MPRFVCPTCGATLYSAAALTKCSWCNTPVPGPPKDQDSSGERDERGSGEVEEQGE
jgi:hypothetical protein